MSKPALGLKVANRADSEYILGRYLPVIGLEIHCQLNTNSKLFCSCSTAFGAPANHHTCPVCLGHPGVLPVLNRQAIDFGIKMALAVKGRLRPVSVFARKQYFYPDLPKGYQITQYDQPYCEGGEVHLENGLAVILRRIHFEEDAGKNIHSGKQSFVDLNRAGIPLLEIVTEPCIHRAKDASEYLKKMRNIVRSLEISDGNLEEGSFRCDVNISVSKKGNDQLGTRCEIKNLNSFKNIEKAIDYEVGRQIDLLEEGQSITQETLLYDPTMGRTMPMRSKEEAQDYRYFQEPDLPPLILSKERIEKLREKMPELPEARALRLIKEHQLTEHDANFLTEDRDLVQYYEAVLQAGAGKISPKIAANWIISELMREVNGRQWNFANLPISSMDFAELLLFLTKGVISGKIAKTVFETMVETGAKPNEIIKRQNLAQISDTEKIRAVVNDILDQNPRQLSDYLGGKEKIFGFFVGELMKVSKGQFNPGIVNKILKELIDERRAKK